MAAEDVADLVEEVGLGEEGMIEGMIAGMLLVAVAIVVAIEADPGAMRLTERMQDASRVIRRVLVL